MIDLNGIKCVSVRQPWAWALVHGYKPVENRSRRTNYRGTVLIHASATETWADYEVVWKLLNQPRDQIKLPVKCALGGIVGMVNIVDCVDRYDSPWFFGPWGWVVQDAMPLPFIPCKGQLGLWTPPSPVLEEVSRYLKAAG